MINVRHVDVVTLLGDANQRYFGEGYRAVQQELTNVHIAPNDQGTLCVAAWLRLVYPLGWSAKEGQKPRQPHLSTLDAFLTSVQLADALLLVSAGVGPEKRRWSWIQSVSIRAGTMAVQELDAISVTGEIVSVSTPCNPLLGSNKRIEMRFRVGALYVYLIIVTQAREICEETVSYSHIDEVLGPQNCRYHGDGFKSHRLNLRLGCMENENAITVSLEKQVGCEDFVDIGAAYTNSPTLIDCILGQAQVSQMLLYNLDHIDRAVSENLWMRKVMLVADGPELSTVSRFKADTSISRTQLLRLAGKTWRTTDFDGRFGHIATKYNLAHALPTKKG